VTWIDRQLLAKGESMDRRIDYLVEQDLVRRKGSESNSPAIF